MQLFANNLTRLPINKPVYLIHGGEILQTSEASVTIRNTLTKQGFTERKVLEVTANFDWQQLIETSQNLSLFAHKQLIELQLKDNKLGLQGSKIITQFLNTLAKDICLLIIANKLEHHVQKTKWFTTIQQLGCVIAAKPIAKENLPFWIIARLKLFNFTTTTEIINLLARLYFGNLPALAQLIEKLAICYAPGQLSLAQISPYLQDHADFNVFNLIDAVIKGNCKEIYQMFNNLRNTKVEPIIILWGITRELRTLIKISFALNTGMPYTEICKKYGIWPSKSANIRAYLNKTSRQQLETILQKLTMLDAIIKGVQCGLFWESLLIILLQLANIKQRAAIESLIICPS